MPRHEEYLIDILESAKLAIEYLSEGTKEDFLQDIQRQDAVIRRIEIIGEAARRIPEEHRAAYPDLPWKAMVRMRNILIHEYDDADPGIV
ncbi:MAG TPA: DUF86 domain-containing protein [Candidatus Hydrogenedentes bacterium]|nr:DUF86 domain-containing protein [Candidatus Hydrogenedentota bacterium]HIJ73749.1 DUF86 domain-containing protein [Candidatus Hydrogenedentota bacterium]